MMTVVLVVDSGSVNGCCCVDDGVVCCRGSLGQWVVWCQPSRQLDRVDTLDSE